MARYATYHGRRVIVRDDNMMVDAMTGAIIGLAVDAMTGGGDTLVDGLIGGAIGGGLLGGVVGGLLGGFLGDD